MIRLLLLLLSLSFSTVFTFIPDIEIKRYKPYTHEGKVIIIDTWALPEDEGFHDYFLFSDQKLTLETHLFFLFEHLILVILSLALYIDAPKYKSALFIFIVIQVLDTLIYLLSYGNLKFMDIPVTWNFMKIFIFSLAIINELWKSKR